MRLAVHSLIFFLSFFKVLFIFRQRGREGEERNIDVWLPLTNLYWGPGLQPSHMLGIEPETLCFAVRCSIC